MSPRQIAETLMQGVGGVFVMAAVWGLLPLFWALGVSGAILITLGVLLELTEGRARGTRQGVPGPLDYE